MATIELDMSELTGMPKPVAAPVVEVSGEREIPVGDIGVDYDNPQPRTEFDQKLIETMAAQFKDPNIGQTDAISVKVNPAGTPPFLIVHGETRHKAAEFGKLATIRSVVTTEDGFVRQLLSNETRGDMSLMDKASAYNELIKNHGYDRKSVAALLGTDVATISRYLALLDMHEIVELAYREGKATGLRVLDDLRKLVASSNAKDLTRIELVVNESEKNGITRNRIAKLSSQLSKKKTKPEATKQAPKIDGKAFKIVDVKGDLLTIKRAGDKAPLQYRLVPVKQPEKV